MKSTISAGPFAAVLFDVDGTLVDSNDAHARAWVEAFREDAIAVTYDEVRRCIGMGGDKLIPEVSGIDADSTQGQRIGSRRGAIFAATHLPTLRPFRGAGALVAALEARGRKTGAASSAKKDELRALLQLAGATSLIAHATSSDDAEESKPDPDIILAALACVQALPGDAVMIGDTPYDVEATTRAGVATVAFRCGGWDDASLAGAIAIYDGPWDLLAHLDASPLN